MLQGLHVKAPTRATRALTSYMASTKVLSDPRPLDSPEVLAGAHMSSNSRQSCSGGMKGARPQAHATSTQGPDRVAEFLGAGADSWTQKK